MRKLAFLLALLPALAFGQSAPRYDSVVQNASGQAIAGASIAVCNQPATTSTLPCSPLATLYPDSTGTIYGITSIVRSGNVVSVTTNTSNSIPLGQWVTIAGVSDTSYNGTFLVTLAGNTFQFQQVGVNSSSAGGTVSGANPTFSSGLGNYHFYAAYGNGIQYTVQIYGQNITTQVKPDQTYGTGSTAPGLASNNTWSGQNSYTNNFTATAGQNKANFYSVNNVLLIDGCSGVASPKYAATSAGINAAIAAAINMGGGTVDARACSTLTTYNSEIDVGNSSGVPVVLLLPPGNSGGTPTWTPTITDGVSYGIKVFSNSAALAAIGSGYSPFEISPTTGSNMGAVLGTDPNGTNEHVNISGINAGVYSGSPTIARAAVVLEHVGDGGLVSNVTGFTLSSTATMTKAVWLRGNCCKASFINIVGEGYNESGVYPCWFGDTTTGPNLGIIFSGSCVHPGNSANNVVDQEYNQYGQSEFHIYMEQAGGGGTHTDTTTPWISMQASGTPTAADVFYALAAAGDVASATRYTLDVASGAHVIGTFQQGSVSTNAVDDHGRSYTNTASANTSFSYSTEPSFFFGGVDLANFQATGVYSTSAPVCTNAELALSGGWGSTASVGSVAGTGQTCEWTVSSSGSGQAANPTITDTLVQPSPSAIVCEMRMTGGTGTQTSLDNTTFSATVPVFTFNGTPVNGSTYRILRRCGP